MKNGTKRYLPLRKTSLGDYMGGDEKEIKIN